MLFNLLFSLYEMTQVLLTICAIRIIPEAISVFSRRHPYCFYILIFSGIYTI